MKGSFTQKKHETGDIYSFFFTVEDINWQPGQYINLTLPGVPPAESDRLFTISSIPSEGTVRITTFIRDSVFKQGLMRLNEGDGVEFDQLGGDFVWQDEPLKKLYIAGGLGITPFRSIMVERSFTRLPQRTVLMWAGTDEQCPFDDELTDIAAHSQDISIHRYIDQRITIDLVIKEVPDISDRLIYIAGSQRFVESIGEGLQKSGVPKERIKYDWFDGYTGTLV